MWGNCTWRKERCDPPGSVAQALVELRELLRPLGERDQRGQAALGGARGASGPAARLAQAPEVTEAPVHRREVALEVVGQKQVERHHAEV